MGEDVKILLELCSGRGTARSAVEGNAAVPSPSTILRMIPLPQTSWGRM
jgi:hypothetical protein